MKAIKLTSKTSELIPTKPGIYRLLDRNKELIYIGKGQNLRHRVTAHYQKNGEANGFESRRDGEAKYVTYRVVPKRALLKKEAEAIKRNGGTRFNRYHGNKRRK